MKIVYANFDSEKEWTDDKAISIFPVLTNSTSNMEELMAVLSEGGIILTNHTIDRKHMCLMKKYGITYDYLLEENIEEFLSQNKASELELVSFGVTEKSVDLAKKLGAKYDYPENCSLREVNSKTFSVNVCKELGLFCDSYIAYSYEEFSQKARAMMEQFGSIMIKEPLGVSGRGNICCENIKQFERLERKLCRQLQKRTYDFCLIIEPFYHISNNFSVQLNVDIDGKVEICSLQEIFNEGFSYGGSISPSAGLMNIISQTSYFDDVGRVGRKLYEAGYYGEICIDSAIADEGLIPVIEINARKSMSYLKNQYDEKIMRSNGCDEVHSALLKIRKTSNVISYCQMVEILDATGELLNLQERRGVLPLTSFSIAKNETRVPVFFYVVDNTVENVRKRIAKIKEIMNGEKG